MNCYDEQINYAFNTCQDEVIRYNSIRSKIFEIYEIIDKLAQPELPNLQQIMHFRANLQKNIFSIEDDLINSPEWSLSRFAAEIRIVVCSFFLESSESITNLIYAFCNKNLSNSYACDNQTDTNITSQFKTTITIRGMPVLLLIKYEDNPVVDQMKLANWADCVLFVFDIHQSITSFQACKSLMKKLYRCGLVKTPCFLVGIKDEDSKMDLNPHMISKFTDGYPNLVYMETVNSCEAFSNIFYSACERAISLKSVFESEKLQLCYQRSNANVTESCTTNKCNLISRAGVSSTLSSLESCKSSIKSLSDANQRSVRSSILHVNRGVECCKEVKNIKDATMLIPTLTITKPNKFTEKSDFQRSKETDQRMTWYRPSNLFKSQLRNGNSKLDQPPQSSVLKIIKQGYLMKKSSSSLKSDWKQKYVVIDQDGQLWYYKNIEDFLNGYRGKSLSLKFVTVKQSVGKNASCSTIIRRNRQLLLPDCNTSDRASTVPFLRQSLSADPCVLKTPLQLSRHVRKPLKKGASLSTNQVNYQPDVDKVSANNGYFTPRKKSRQTHLDECSFTIVSVNGRSLMFEANSSKEREEWIESIQDQITLLLLNRSKANDVHSSNSPCFGHVKLLLKPLAGNQVCADCGAPDPDWASINLGILVCIDCSGSHRDLGTHISRIRSLNLDSWNEDLQTTMKSFGNQFANRIWEAKLWEDPKPTPTSSRDYKDKWVRWKYQEKRFILDNHTLPDKEMVLEKLVKFIEHRRNRSLYSVIYTHPNIKSLLVKALKDGRHLIHLAAEVGDVVALQLLLWNGVNPDVTDNKGNTAMYYAKQSKRRGCEKILGLYGVTDERRSSYTSSYSSVTTTSISKNFNTITGIESPPSYAVETLRRAKNDARANLKRNMPTNKL